MKILKITSVLLLMVLAFASCKVFKKSSSSMTYMEKLYTSLKNELPEAQVIRMGDTVKVIYPEVGMFDFGKDVLKEESRPSFMKFAKVIKNYPELNFIINGYTDNVGTDEVNMDLSSRRAQTGKNVLVENAVDASRIVTNGMGSANPVMSNATDQGRAANRRVEFLLYKAK